MAKQPKKKQSKKTPTKKISKEKDFIKVGRKKIFTDTPVYEIIKAAAKLKGESIKKFVERNPKAIERYAEKGSDAIELEFDKIEDTIDNLGKRSNVYNKGNKISKSKAKFLVHSFKSNLMSIAEVYDKILTEVIFDMKGNILLDLPEVDEYIDLDEEDELLYWIDRKYDNIKYFTNKDKKDKD